MRLMRLASLPLIIALALGCGGSDSTVVDVHGVAVDLTITVHDGGGIPGDADGPVTLSLGESVALGAVAKNALGLTVGGVSVAWSSSDATVVEITADGVVTAVGEGSADVEASALELSATLGVVVAGAAS